MGEKWKSFWSGHIRKLIPVLFTHMTSQELNPERWGTCPWHFSVFLSGSLSLSPQHLLETQCAYATSGIPGPFMLALPSSKWHSQQFPVLRIYASSSSSWNLILSLPLNIVIMAKNDNSQHLLIIFCRALFEAFTCSISFNSYKPVGRHLYCFHLTVEDAEVQSVTCSRSVTQLVSCWEKLTPRFL